MSTQTADITIFILIILIIIPNNNSYSKVRLPVCNIDLAYTEEMWGELKDTKGDGHVTRSSSLTLLHNFIIIIIIIINSKTIISTFFLTPPSSSNVCVPYV